MLIKIIKWFKNIFKASALFEVSIINGKIERVEGDITKAMVHDFFDICNDLKIYDLQILGYKNREQVILNFSNPVAVSNRQRFQNILTFYY